MLQCKAAVHNSPLIQTQTHKQDRRQSDKLRFIGMPRSGRKATNQCTSYAVHEASRPSTEDFQLSKTLSGPLKSIFESLSGSCAFYLKRLPKADGLCQFLSTDRDSRSTVVHMQTKIRCRILPRAPFACMHACCSLGIHKNSSPAFHTYVLFAWKSSRNCSVRTTCPISSLII